MRSDAAVAAQFLATTTQAPDQHADAERPTEQAEQPTPAGQAEQVGTVSGGETAGTCHVGSLSGEADAGEAGTGAHEGDSAAAGSDVGGDGLSWYGDTAYGTGDLRGAIEEAGHRAVITPKPLAPAVEGGFTLDDFTIDEAAGTLTCPAGQTRALTPNRTVSFGSLCGDCPLRELCTTAKTGRAIKLHEHDDQLRAARAEWATDPDLREDYRRHRPNIERTPRPGRHPERTAGQAALLRHHQEQRLAQVPHRRTEPAQPHRPRSHPRRPNLGPDHLTAPRGHERASGEAARGAHSPRCRHPTPARPGRARYPRPAGTSHQPSHEPTAPQTEPSEPAISAPS